ncbi:YggT family protein [Halomicronema sp. CCY15110]|uniref:YggT family protein n=1 Tax=Halomicronema sp. CCY15110 TaxID=2767773 RepID=UPI00194E25DC|nr:YggT family protein [Halomicronema sp. CCY15110]
MNQSPNNNLYEQSDRERQRQELAALHLRQEAAQLKAAKRQRVFGWIRNTIILLVGALETLLALCLFLRLTRSNPNNAFASFIFDLSDPFVAPFSTLFISPTNADASRIFDLNLIFAMTIYALLGALALACLHYLQGRNPYGS